MSPVALKICDFAGQTRRGGIGGYSPPSEHPSPPSEGKKRFFRRLLAFIVPWKIYFSPLVGRVSPPVRKFLAPPCKHGSTMCFHRAAHWTQDHWSTTGPRTIGQLLDPGPLVNYWTQDHWSTTVTKKCSQAKTFHRAASDTLNIY